ncbi:MAG: sortase [Acidimicrobiales bacterium]
MDDADLPEPEPSPTGNRRAFLGMLAGGAVVVAGGGAAWRLLGQDPAPVQAAPTTTTDPPQLRVTTSTLPPLPVPDPLPENANADTPQIVIGTIELPRIGVSADIQEGITLTAINRGPGHWPNTAMPGALGNVVIAGHRTTYSKPFNRLDELQPGDRVTMATADGRFDYEVRGIVIVPGEAVDIATQTYAHTATLFACHPPGSARQRIVAKLRLLDAAGRPVDPDSALPPLDAGTQETDHSLVVRAATDPLSASGP